MTTISLTPREVLVLHNVLHERMLQTGATDDPNDASIEIIFHKLEKLIEDSVGEHDARMFEKRLITWEQDQKAKISKLEKKSEDQRVTVQEPCDTLTCELNDDHSAFSYPKPNAPRPVMPYHKGRYKAKHTK